MTILSLLLTPNRTVMQMELSLLNEQPLNKNTLWCILKTLLEA
jgi:hypothetical protein